MKPILNLKVVLIGVLVLVVALGLKLSLDQRVKEENVVLLGADDVQVTAAQAQAQNEMGYIKNLLQNPDLEKYDFSVKSDFIDGETHEHMWVEVESYKDGYFYGILGNQPVYVTHLKFHDPISVKEEAVEDWVVYDKTTDTMVGGFSVKALQEKKSN